MNIEYNNLLTLVIHCTKTNVWNGGVHVNSKNTQIKVKSSQQLKTVLIIGTCMISNT